MTVPAQFVPRNYDVFAGLDVDKKSMAVIFTDHEQLMQSLRLPYSATQLLNYGPGFINKRQSLTRKTLPYIGPW